MASEIRYCVVAGVKEAHEAECVYSLWSTEEQARSEIERLKAEHIPCGVYEGGWSISAVEVDTPRDWWIE